MNSLDAQLLERYLEENSDDAFAELVRRHFDFVYSAAARQLAGDRDLARDVAQTVFADLARKARSLTNRGSLAGWLYTSTHYAAANVVRTERRRREREQVAVAVQCANSDCDSDQDELQPAVDRALVELHETDRDALILRYFEQRELRSVGEAFGISEEAARKRVERALEKVRAILARDGVSATSATVAGRLSRSLAHSAPIGLAVTVAKVARSAMPLNSAAPALLPAIAMTKTKIVVLGTLVLAAAITPIILQQRLIQRLRLENARANEAAAVTQPSAVATVPAGGTDSELERLRLEHSELLRLRAELARLRRELAEASTKRSAAQPPPPLPVIEPDRSAEPIQSFIANAEALVPAGSGLIFGGWPTAPGKRILIFLQPKVLDASSPGHIGSILLEGKFFEMPDDALSALGLDKFKSSARATSTHSLLGADEIRSLLETLQNMPGVNLLSRPRIQTGDGTQAVLSVTENKIIAGQEHALGPSLDIDPRIASDGSSVILTVSARLKKATAE